MPWGDIANGREILIRTSDSHAVIRIPQGYSIYSSAGREINSFILEADSLSRMVGFQDYWVVYDPIKISNIS